MGHRVDVILGNYARTCVSTYVPLHVHDYRERTFNYCRFCFEAGMLIIK